MAPVTYENSITWRKCNYYTSCVTAWGGDRPEPVQRIVLRFAAQMHVTIRVNSMPASRGFPARMARTRRGAADLPSSLNIPRSSRNVRCRSCSRSRRSPRPRLAAARTIRTATRTRLGRRQRARARSRASTSTSARSPARAELALDWKDAGGAAARARHARSRRSSGVEAIDAAGAAHAARVRRSTSAIRSSARRCASGSTRRRRTCASATARRPMRRACSG